jgi:hypothetical protein
MRTTHGSSVVRILRERGGRLFVVVVGEEDVVMLRGDNVEEDEKGTVRPVAKD